ncbi:hypothetical protein AB0F46_33660 [Streptomyces sp. NPDC026665]|uniref:hypothetical protein n=1 Tax=Streptomyces sp. NPDC026665 TaxID=3154798 RepID=UPI0033D15640
MKTRENRWLLLCAALSLWGLTGCAGTGGETPGPQTTSGSPAATPATSAAPAPPLSAQALKSIALTGDDVPGNRGVSADERAHTDSKSTFPPVSDSSCEKLLNALGAGDASAVVDQVFNWKGSIWAGGGTLASYADTDAESAFADVRTSLPACHDYTGVGFTGKYTAHLAPESIPHLGDESIAFRITVPVKQGTGLRSGRRVSVRNEQHILVRVGRVTAHFTMLDMDHEDHFPLALVRKEVARMTQAQHR